MGNVCSTVQARVVVVDGLNHTAEVQLHVLLDQASVEGAKMALLVVHTAG